MELIDNLASKNAEQRTKRGRNARLIRIIPVEKQGHSTGAASHSFRNNPRQSDTVRR